MKRINTSFCALFLFLIVTVGGCSFHYQPVSKENLPFLFEVNHPSLQTLNGIARVQIENKLGNYVISQKIWYQHPDKVRLETIGIFGLPLVHTLVKEKTVNIFIPINNVLLTGHISELGDAFTLRDILTELFQGTVPAIGEEHQNLRFKESRRFSLISWDGQGLTHKVWIDKRSNSVTKYDIYSKRNNRLLKRVERTAFFRDKGSYFPRHIAIYDRESGQKVTISFLQLKVNEEVTGDIFKLPLPAQYEEKDLREFLQELP